MTAVTAPSIKMLVSGLSGRYALALFELAEEAGKIDAISDELDGLARLVEENADLARLVRSPAIGRSEAKAALAALGGKLGLSELVMGFLGVLATHRRLPALARIVADFRRLRAAHRGEVVARVVSAAPLDEAPRAALSDRLKEFSGREVTLDCSVDPSLLGGLVVQLGSQMIDGSVATRLSRLERAMKGM